ncbi:hypothetical protein Pcinc_030946 [Petrolisthes cinctipes]|uniref:G-protein coupled receptors family 2 profile 2 domain-containing protein n=1 Tax=Petrolisthes cinctipes TaxID=88211 RepID=A0AAE1EXN9_PETCI|nr:hypothetical protein Pcinc_030946 [Petrolisthes cinctipes]
MVVVTSSGENITNYEKHYYNGSAKPSVHNVDYTEPSHIPNGAPHNDYTDSDNSTLHKAGNTEIERFYSGILRKCRCDGGQAWNGSSCLDRPTRVAVYESELKQIFIVDSDHFNQVMVGEPQCPSHHLLVTLDSSRNLDHQFSLLPSGHLYWYQREFDLYCIDHVQPSSDDIGNDEMWWEAHVCLSPPSLPRCCPSGVALTDDLWCGGNNSQQVLTPPIIVEGLVVTWPGETHSQPQQHNCSYTTLSLSSSEAYLKYSPDTVSLVWSPTLSQWKEQDTDFCVGVQEDTEYYLVRVCQENLLNSHLQRCNQSTCVRKCCPEHEIMHVSKCEAAESTEIWTPLFYDVQDKSSVALAPADMTIITGYPLCQDFFKLEPHIYNGDQFLLLNNGYLYVSSFQEYYPPTHYCIDKFYDDNDNTVYTQALACFQENVAEIACGATKKYVYPILLLVSSGFLGATLIIYASVSDLRNKLNGKCLISQVSALLVGYISLSVASLATDHMPPLLCKITGEYTNTKEKHERNRASIIHLAILAGFFWLNVMCFDIWRTLRKMRTVSGSPEWIRRRFLWYSVYSWGCPLLITIVAVIIEQLPDSYNLIRPDFGTDFCWFQSKRSLWVYLYVYILALVLANIVFFILVTIILCRSQNNPNLKRSRETVAMWKAVSGDGYNVAGRGSLMAGWHL